MSNRIVILGGGFAGMNVARKLQKLCRDDSSVQITLINRDNFFLMTPLLFEAGSGVLEPRHAVNPLRLILGTPKNLRFIEAEVTGVDVERRVVGGKVVHREAIEIEYDHLVIAVGGTTNTSLVKGAENAMTFKTLADAVYLRNFVIRRFEEADVEKDENVKRARLTFVVIGAGLVGVELQGELQEFANAAAKNYANINRTQLRFELIEHGSRIMKEMDEDLADYAKRVFEKRGIKVRCDTPVNEVTAGKVHLKNGEVIEASTIVVATGVVPSPLVKKIEKIEHGPKGHIRVDATMRSVSHRNVWALGDCAFIPDPDGKPYPALAQHALREARLLAKNVAADIKGQPTKPFIYRSKGTLAALGGFQGVGRVFFLKLKGFPAWTAWRAYYLLQMPGITRRIRIMMDWLVAILFGYDIVEVNFDRDVSSAPVDPVSRQTTHPKHDTVEPVDASRQPTEPANV